MSASLSKTLPWAIARKDHQVCTRCVMDTTVPEIRFDAEGVCQYCHIHDAMDQKYPAEPTARAAALQSVVERIQEAGRGKKYDCVIGISGGRDSAWGLYNAVKLGLRPLAVHFDNGWNSSISVSNIENVTRALNVDLETFVMDWEEFRDLQVSFLKASVPDVEVPTDVGIHGVLHRVAAKEQIRYVFFCHSFRTEGIAPMGWTYLDGKYIESVQKEFGTVPLASFPNFKIPDLFRYTLGAKIKVVPLLNYLPYNQKAIDETLTRELGWTYYGGHHHESTYTHFIQSYLLPRKFKIDKRKTEFSALIRSGQHSRADALETLRTTPYEYDETLLPYILAKLELTPEQWQEIYARPARSFHEFSSYYSMVRLFRFPLRVAVQMGIVPQLLYMKFFG